MKIKVPFLIVVKHITYVYNLLYFENKLFKKLERSYLKSTYLKIKEHFFFC